MKKGEVPQDRLPEYGNERRALYAVDDSGHYQATPSAGWKADQVVNEQACDEYRRLAQEALERARAGITAPLEYHMYDRRMEVDSLAPAVGLWKWRVRRHLKPDVFKALGSEMLARYAEAMGISVEQLTRLP